MYRSDDFDPVKSWLIMAGMEFMVWRESDTFSEHPTRIVWRNPARPLEPDSMAEMLRYCGMAWRAV